MKAGELVVLHKELLKVLSENDIKMSDWKYAGLWEEYCKALRKGAKVSALVAEYAIRFDVAETNVWRALKRMRREVDVIGDDETPRRAKRRRRWKKRRYWRERI